MQMQRYKYEDERCPRSMCYKAYGSGKEDAPVCDVPGFENSRMKLLRHVSFVDCPVLLSLNGIDDDKVRLLSKAEFILSSRKSVMWDVQFFNIQISIPWENAESVPYKMVCP